MNRIVNVPKLVWRLWLCLWIVLGLLVVAKFCFNEWYPIIVKNEKILSASSFIDNNKWLDVLIMLFFYLLNCNITFLTCIRRMKYKSVHIFICMFLTFVLSFIFKTFVSNYLAFIIEFVLVIAIPIFLNIKRKTFSKMIMNIAFSLIVNVVLALWQMCMLYVRGIDKLLTTMPCVIKYTINIDYYIFLIITWIGVCYFMGSLGLWFWGKDETELKAMLQKEQAKEKPNQKRIEAIKKALENAQKIKA